MEHQLNHGHALLLYKSQGDAHRWPSDKNICVLDRDLTKHGVSVRNQHHEPRTFRLVHIASEVKPVMGALEASLDGMDHHDHYPLKSYELIGTYESEDLAVFAYQRELERLLRPGLHPALQRLDGFLGSLADLLSKAGYGKG